MNSYNPFNLNVTLARAIIALSMIITLIFSDIEDLFVVESFSTEIIGTTVFNKLSFFIIAGIDNLQYAKFLAILILLLVILGMLPKITSVLHWWISLSFIQSAAMVEGGDQISVISTFIFMLISFLDTRSNLWKDVDISQTINPIRITLAQILILLFWIQISYLYFQASSSKLNLPEWKNGSVIYYWITNNTFGTPYFPQSILKSKLLTLIMSWIGIIIEIALAYSILSTWKVRKIIFIIGIAFHIGIYFLLGLASFSLVMVGVLILYALPPISANRLRGQLQTFKIFNSLYKRNVLK